jgi:hypothetical protein
MFETFQTFNEIDLRSTRSKSFDKLATIKQETNTFILCQTSKTFGTFNTINLRYNGQSQKS